MQFVDGYPDQPFTRLKIVHKSESCHWNLDYYAKVQDVTTDKVFHFLNQFIATLQTSRQKALFDVYQKARGEIDAVVDPNMLHRRLTQTIKELYQLVDFDEIRQFTRYNADIKVPSVIADEYSQLGISERSQDYRESTYLRADYIDLINLAIYLKFTIPIWAEYARLISKAGNMTFREYQTMSLLNSSQAIDVAPMNRLRSYIETQIDSEKNSSHLSAVLGGLGTTEIPDWMLAIVVIRKLVIVDLSSYERERNVVSVIYSYVKNNTKSIDRKFSGYIKNKPKPRQERDDNEKFVLETYKIKQDASDGDLMVLSIYAENPVAMAQRIEPNVEPERVMQCYNYCYHLTDIVFSMGQLTLLRWAMSPILPPQSIQNIRKSSLLSMIACAQAVMWFRGHYDLAKLVAAHELVDDVGMLVGGSDSHRRIPKEYANWFDSYYPHSSDRGDRDRSRQTNVTIKAIEALTKDFIKCHWVVHGPPELLEQGSDVDGDQVLMIPQDFRIQLACWTLELAQYQEYQPNKLHIADIVS